MLSEFALIPEVLQVSDGSSTDLHNNSVAQLTDLLLNDGLVRDLRNGGWRKAIDSQPELLSEAGKKLYKAILADGRLRASPATDLENPTTSEEWLWEALRSSEDSPEGAKLTAVLATDLLAQDDDGTSSPVVTPVTRLHEAEWWKKRSCSVRLERNTPDYLRHLRPVLRHSNSLMFIDPYLDPKKANYKEFGALLVHAAGFGTKPRVEIHRSCRDSSGQDTRSEFPKRNEWQGRFNPLIKSLAGHGIKVRIFIWKDFHDRYLISNLIGISVPHGFDICLNGRRHSIRTTWTRLSRRDAREVQRDFDADAERDRLHYEPFP